jgi:hypothetical protein
MKKETVLTWEQWATDTVEAEKEGERLRAKGWFTAVEFSVKTGTPIDKARHLLSRRTNAGELESRRAYDPRSHGKIFQILFYHVKHKTK